MPHRALPLLLDADPSPRMLNLADEFAPQRGPQHRTIQRNSPQTSSLTIYGKALKNMTVARTDFLPQAPPPFVPFPDSFWLWIDFETEDVRHFVGTERDSLMKSVNVFSARDLRNRAGGLLKDAEAGRFSVITKHGRPAALAMPFDALLLELGAHRHLAVRLYTQRLLTLAQAAKLASLPIEQFLDVLGASGVNVVDYPAKELGPEVEALR